MGAVPKHKTSSYRKGKRRSQKNLSPRRFLLCSQCQAPRLSHQACPKCGFYPKKTK